MKKTKVIAVVGPTASGKTSLAIALAQQFAGEVISCDSRQVYRGLDEGTAKVTKEEMAGVSHHLLDVADVADVYTATDFKQDAEQAITDIISRKKVPIIAGGTFFYLDQLLGRSTAPAVEPDHLLRAALETKTCEELFKELQVQDPKRATTIDPQNKRRIIRALEIVKALGEVPAEAMEEPPYDFLIIGIKVDKETLRARFRSRAEDWLSGAFEKEVRGLLKKGVSRERLSEIGFEYLLMLEYIDGELSDEDFVQKCIEKNWQYAKRQYTWLKRDQEIRWIESDNLTEAEAMVSNFLS